MKCRKCGSQIDDDSIYCEICGAKQTGLGSSTAIIVIVAVAAAVAIGVLIFLLLRGCQSDTPPLDPPKTPKPEESSAVAETKDFTGMNLYPMVWVEGGEFVMGDSRQNAADEDCPPHSVELDGFWIGQREVSRGLWRQIMGSDPSVCSQQPDGTPLTHEEKDLMPVENVGYDDVCEFIGKLNAATGKQFDLPSEAQWEYAARGGNKSEGHRFANGQDTPGGIRFNGLRSPSRTVSTSVKPNELGIYHMSGNVAEWCKDFYDEDFYTQSSRRNPLNTDETGAWVVRGGSFDDAKSEVVTVFHRDVEDCPREYIGFRLVLKN